MLRPTFILAVSSHQIRIHAQLASRNRRGPVRLFPVWSSGESRDRLGRWAEINPLVPPNQLRALSWLLLRGRGSWRNIWSWSRWCWGFCVGARKRGWRRAGRRSSGRTRSAGAVASGKANDRRRGSMWCFCNMTTGAHDHSKSVGSTLTSVGSHYFSCIGSACWTGRQRFGLAGSG